jgi:hypothetical protein
LPGQCGQLGERLQKRALRFCVVDSSLIGLYFGLQDIGRISLAYIRKLMGSFNGVAGKYKKPLTNIHDFLSGEGGIEALSYVTLDTITLFGESKLVFTSLLLEDIPAEPELTSENDVLLDESSLFTAAI